MDNLSQNAKTLLIVGIVLIVLCIIGIMVQGSTYMELTSDKHHSSSGRGSGAMSALQSMIAWNKSDKAKADQALNMLIFMIMGCAAGVACVWYALRRPKEEPETNEDHRPIHPHDVR